MNAYLVILHVQLVLLRARTVSHVLRPITTFQILAEPLVQQDIFQMMQHGDACHAQPTASHWKWTCVGKIHFAKTLSAIWLFRKTLAGALLIFRTSLGLQSTIRSSRLTVLTSFTKSYRHVSCVLPYLLRDTFSFITLLLTSKPCLTTVMVFRCISQPTIIHLAKVATVFLAQRFGSWLKRRACLKRKKKSWTVFQRFRRQCLILPPCLMFKKLKKQVSFRWSWVVLRSPVRLV